MSWPEEKTVDEIINSGPKSFSRCLDNYLMRYEIDFIPQCRFVEINSVVVLYKFKIHFTTKHDNLLSKYKT